MMTVRGVLVAAGFALCSLLALPPEAAAQDAEALLEEGIVRFKVGNFRKSLEVLRRARRKTKDLQILGRIHLYLGMNHAVLKKPGQAEKAFIQALTNSPTLALRPQETKQAIIDLLEKVRQGLKGTLEISSDRPGATVRIDGKEVGQTPCKKEVVIGQHRLELATADGLYSFEAQVLVGVGKTRPVRAVLKMTGGELSVTTRPAGARVVADGRELGLTPFGGAALPAGKRRIRVEREGYKPHLATVTIQRGKSESIEVELRPLESKPAAAAPAGARPARQVDEGAGRRGFPIWTAVTAGVAVAAGAVGLGFGLASRSSFEDYERTMSREEHLELRDTVSEQATVANVSFAVAGAMAVTSLVLFLTLERPWGSGESKKAWLGPGPGGASLCGTF